VKILTLEELRESLEKANDEMETSDAALQSLTNDTDPGVVDELRADFDTKVAEVARVAEAIERKEKMAKAKADIPRPSEDARNRGEERVRIMNEPLTYRTSREGGQHAFFSDVYSATHGSDFEAAARLQRHTREMALNGETRAMTTAGGSGVGIVPPQFFQDQLATFARAGRPFADAIGSRPLPDVGVSFNIPRITTGLVTAVQAAEAGAVNDSSAVTDDIVLALNTVAGKVDMSRQLAERSGPAADEILGADLAADYAKQLDTQLLNQAANGVLLLAGTNSSVTAVTTIVSLYAKVADAIQLIHTNRFAAPNLIVMHPRRWGSILAAVDGSNRPLVVPDATSAIQSFNAMGGAPNYPTPQGLVGTIQGLPVVTDANIPTNFGAGTNEDRVIVTRTQDQALFEAGTPTIQVMTEVLSGNLQVRVMAYGYFAFTFARYPKSNSIISGAGLIPPTF
jgi:HK97 family phage major capsid protein